MLNIPTVQKGTKLSARWGRDITDRLNNNIVSKPVYPQIKKPSQPYPFKLLPVGVDTIRVYPGTVNGVIPQILTNPIDTMIDDEYPTFTLTDGSWIVLLEINWTPASVDIDGEIFIVGGGSLAGDVPVIIQDETGLASFLSSNTVHPTSDGVDVTDGKYYQRIGKVTYDGTAITYIYNDTLQDSINCHFCAPERFWCDGINSTVFEEL